MSQQNYFSNKLSSIRKNLNPTYNDSHGDTVYLAASPNRKIIQTIGELLTGISWQLQDANDVIKESINVNSSTAAQLNKCTDLIISLTELSKELYLEQTNIDIRPLVERVVSEVKMKLNQPMVHINCEFDTSKRSMMIDPTLLETCLSHLIQNAVEAISGEGAITLSVEDITQRGEKKLRINISDSGHGIHESDIPQVILPYFSKGKPGHDGQGLTIANNIIRAHGGALRIKSAPSMGTTISILLPM